METVVLTAEMIHGAAATPPHGFTADQLRVFGIHWPPRKGWLEGMVGKEIWLETFEEFRAGGKYQRRRQVRRQKRVRAKERSKDKSLDAQLTAILARSP